MATVWNVSSPQMYGMVPVKSDLDVKALGILLEVKEPYEIDLTVPITFLNGAITN